MQSNESKTVFLAEVVMSGKSSKALQLRALRLSTEESYCKRVPPLPLLHVFFAKIERMLPPEEDERHETRPRTDLMNRTLLYCNEADISQERKDNIIGSGERTSGAEKEETGVSVREYGDEETEERDQRQHQNEFVSREESRGEQQEEIDETTMKRLTQRKTGLPLAEETSDGRLRRSIQVIECRLTTG